MDSTHVYKFFLFFIDNINYELNLRIILHVQSSLAITLSPGGIF